MQTAISRAEGSWDSATKTQPDGSLVNRNLVPTPAGGEFEMIRTTYRRRG